MLISVKLNENEDHYWPEYLELGVLIKSREDGKAAWYSKNTLILLTKLFYNYPNFDYCLRVNVISNQMKWVLLIQTSRGWNICTSFFFFFLISSDSWNLVQWVYFSQWIAYLRKKVIWNLSNETKLHTCFYFARTCSNLFSSLKSPFSQDTFIHLCLLIDSYL